MKNLYYELYYQKYTQQLKFLTNIIYEYLHYFLVRK